MKSPRRIRYQDKQVAIKAVRAEKQVKKQQERVWAEYVANERAKMQRIRNK